ncbi:UvrD-helicase domain-containing protein, partial [Paracoccaceae bacterium]|nr:UvrD-helicase domain-containing protein [Paracoccaceae bacterium]
LLSEWENVIDDWGIETLEEYTGLSRVGRKSKLGTNQRNDLWRIFDETKQHLKSRNLTTWSHIFRELSLTNDPSAQYDHVIIDEAQDISSAELSFLARHYGNKPNGLFFAGDIGQRIFRAPFSWSSLGVDVRGKSNILKVNYRTSQQIRAKADLLLPKEIKDGDNQSEDRSGTVSVFSGEPPKISLSDDEAGEAKIVSDWIKEQVDQGIAPTEIGVFVRTEHQYKRALNAIKNSGNTGVVLNYKLDGDDSSINYGTMHLAKGLEFRSVAVMACDDSVLPLRERVKLFTEYADIEEVERTERQLLYVACTRARESLLVTGVGDGSKYLYELIS